MNLKIIISVFFYLVIISKMDAQTDDKSVVLDILPIDNSVVMINGKGEVVCTFPTGARLKVEDKMNNTFTVFSLERSFVYYDFSNGYLPVVHDKKWKFYNEKGEEIKDLGDMYTSFTTPVDGVCRAYEKSTDGNFTTVFINQFFEEMFSGQRFTEATNMKDGYAFAKLKDGIGSWAVVSGQTGQMIVLDSMLSIQIKEITKDPKGLGIVKYKNQYKTDYIDKNGKIISPNEVKNTSTKEEELIKKNIQTCLDNHSFAISTGIGILKKELAPDLRSNNKTLEWGLVVNHDFIPSWMNLKKSEFFFCNVANEKYFGGTILDTISEKTEFRYYDFIDKKLIFTSEKEIEYIYGNKFFVTSPSSTGYGTKLTEIYDTKGQLLYSLHPTKRHFNGISATSGFDPDDVFSLYISNDEDISTLNLFGNLRHIEFGNCSFLQLPELLSSMLYLKSVKVTACPNLTELPAFLSKSTTFQSLEIADCPKLKNIEQIIESSPSLQKVKTQNYNFVNGFGNKMKLQKPELKFDVSFMKSH